MLYYRHRTSIIAHGHLIEKVTNGTLFVGIRGWI